MRLATVPGTPPLGGKETYVRAEVKIPFENILHKKNERKFRQLGEFRAGD